LTNNIGLTGYILSVGYLMLLIRCIVLMRYNIRWIMR